MAFNEDSSSGHDEPWIQWFCGLKGHEMFCEVERSYIEDGFNLYGLRAYVSNFSDCLDLILDRIGPDEDSDDSHLTQSACTLYGLIHARYILTAHGLDAMYGKYAAKEFGICPLVQCAGQPVLPVSLKDEIGAGSVKVYCPKCSQVYHPPPSRSRSLPSSSSSAAAAAAASGATGSAGAGAGSNSNTATHQLSALSGTSGGVDGAAFGTTFPHLFLMTFSNLVPDPLPIESTYIPRVFGFRVHKAARQRFNVSSTTSNAAASSGLQTPLALAVAEGIQEGNNNTAACRNNNLLNSGTKLKIDDIDKDGNKNNASDRSDDDDSQSLPTTNLKGPNSAAGRVEGSKIGAVATPALNEDDFDDMDENSRKIRQSLKRGRKSSNNEDDNDSEVNKQPTTNVENNNNSNVKEFLINDNFSSKRRRKNITSNNNNSNNSSSNNNST